MKREQIKLTYEIELQPGENLNLPASLVNSVGAGRWLITIEQEATPTITRSHDAFLRGYAPEDEGLYNDYPSR